MVDRYKGSTAVPTAPVARPADDGSSKVADAVRGLGRTALSIATKRIEERDLSLENASLNAAKIELEKRGSQMALDLQKDRVAGSDYVKDLTKARSKLKQEVWTLLPARVQNSIRARDQFDDIWTSDEIQASRSATIWQAEQEKSFALRTIEDGLNVTTAGIEADPDSTASALATWRQSLPAYKGLVDAETLEKIQTKGVQSVLQASVRGLAKQGRFEEAEAVVSKAAAQLDPQQRKAFESVIEDAKNDIEREKARREAELVKRQEATRALMAVDIWDGKVNRQRVETAFANRDINETDRERLLGTLRDYHSHLKAEAALSAEERAAHNAVSAVMKSQILSMPADLLLMPTERWAQADLDRLDLLTIQDRAELDTHINELIVKGPTANAVSGIQQDIVAAAQRTMPKGWALSGQNLKPNERKLLGLIYDLAKKESEQTGGKPIEQDRAAELAAMAYHQFNAKKYAEPEGFDPLANLARDVDPQTYADIKRRLQERTGKTPTDRQIMDAYWRLRTATLEQEEAN